LRTTLAESFKERYWATGIFATVTMSLIIPFSIRPMREKLYEVFLLLHIALALATLVLLFYHVEIYDGQYDGSLWACVAIWVSNRPH
jgi:RsiW-degrading membrane proteinase PrsW (M82 family)